MKNIMLLAAGIFIITHSLSQSCLPEGIYFSSQTEIDNFQTNFPNCTEIEGEVKISGDDIINLDGLEIINSIGGSLKIYSNPFLKDLNGLNNLTLINGDLWIDENDSLINLTGLENLSQIYGLLRIGFNHSLSSLQGINNLTSISGHFLIFDNHALLDINGLTSLNYIGNSVEIMNCSSLSNLEGLNNLDSIGDRLFLSNIDLLTNLSGLTNLNYIGAGLIIQHNLSLTSISNLDNLLSIGGNLWIYDNSSLTDLTGLQNVNSGSIDSLYLIGNPNLTICNVKSICDYLASPNGTIEIHDNATGCDSQEEVAAACLNGFDEVTDLASHLSIYPNPSSTQITIEVPNKSILTDCTYLTIYNITGQEIMKHQITETITVLDIMGLNAGVYLVKTVSQDNVLVNKILKTSL
jgi:hypothetical protein